MSPIVQSNKTLKSAGSRFLLGSCPIVAEIPASPILFHQEPCIIPLQIERYVKTN